MSNDNCVTKLIQKTDNGVRLTVFDDTTDNTYPEVIYEDWLKFIQNCLGNCVFHNEFCALSMYNVNGESMIPLGISSTEDVIKLVRNCFDFPETLRIDITTPHSTTFSWVFVLLSDLSK